MPALGFELFGMSLVNHQARLVPSSLQCPEFIRTPCAKCPTLQICCRDHWFLWSTSLPDFWLEHCKPFFDFYHSSATTRIHKLRGSPNPDFNTFSNFRPHKVRTNRYFSPRSPSSSPFSFLSYAALDSNLIQTCSRASAFWWWWRP